MHLKGTKIAVIGLGRSGLAACRFCIGRGAQVLGVDDMPPDRFDGARASELEGLGVELHLGEQPAERLRAMDLLVVSPGIPPSAAVDAAEAADVPVVAEVELASWFLEAPILAITGTNGKSTVTALIGEIMKATGRPTFVGGNFGIPLIEAIGTDAGGPDGALVVELSSFQLERTQRFRPRVAVLLNLSEDHLDRYPTMAEYVAAKGRIFLAQEAVDHAVVDGDDPLSLSLARAGAAKVHPFGRSAGEAYVQKGAIVDAGAPGGPARYPLELLKIVGEHNHSNASAAALACRLAGASPEAIRRGLSSFAGLPHRMERVAEIDGVVFYNDSKATNVGATAAALRGLDRPVVLIAGGHDKGGEYEPLRPLLRDKVRQVVLIGEATELIERALAGAATFVRATDMADAVARAAAAAQPGDAVLMAPACSSFDMYRNFMERGEDFRHAVSSMIKKQGAEGTTLPDPCSLIPDQKEP
jgi:UDP-N-acetylmuramoylalanine--D-glutamate ligase